MRKRSLLVLLLSMVMVLSPAFSVFAGSDASAEETQPEAVPEVAEEVMAENGDDAAIVEEPAAVEEAVTEETEEDASGEQSDPESDSENDGADETCAHENKEVYIDWDRDAVSYIDEGDDSEHRISGDLYEVTYCLDCDEELSREPYYGNYYSNHEYDSDGICVLCQHKNRCEHENSFTWYEYDSSNVDIEQGDAETHRVTGHIIRKVTCSNCLVTLEEEDLGNTTVNEDHEFDGGVCYICEYGCEHADTHKEYSYDCEEAEIENVDENQHSITGNIVEEIVCDNCDLVLEENDLGYTTVYEDHEYEGGACIVCDKAEDPTEDPIEDTGWSEDGNYYYDDNGNPVKGWKEIDEDWYYFDKSSGVKKTGWLKDGGYWYYLDPEDGFMYSDWWAEIDEKQYYFDDSGKMKTGWYKETWTDEEDGETYTDWYFFDKTTGVMKTGWLKDGGYWYYLDPDEGYMYYDWQEIGGKQYYFDASGKMKTGWLKYSETYEEEDGETYTFTCWYYFNASGVQLFGWQKISNKWYYFDEEYSGGAMAYGWWDIGNKTYLFTNNGVWRNSFTGWYQEDGEWFYFKKGVGLKGWQKISGTWYYFYDYGGMAVNTWASDNSGEYWMDKNGKISKNKWIKDYEGDWYYMGSNGHPVCNKWMKDSKGWCYLDDTGRMVTENWAKDSKGWCWIGENGYMPVITDWIDFEGDRYYIIDGYRVDNKTIEIDGTEYTFDSEGKLIS